MKSEQSVSSLTTTYPKLLKALKGHIQAGQKAIEYNQALTYWNVGHCISLHILNGKDRAQYAEHLYEKLSRDLKVNVRTLEQSVKFSREFPIPNARSELGWTHYRVLLTVQDQAQRLELKRKVIHQHLTSRQLEEEVKKSCSVHKKVLSKRQTFPLPHVPAQLCIVRGKLYHYKIITSVPKAIQRSKDYWVVDCGFESRRLIKRTPGRKFKNGDIIESIKNKEQFNIRASGVAEEEIYTFKAYLERVVDGDTIWVNVDCGFYNLSHQKLRLRSIDTPELNTPGGRRARRFVEQILGRCDFFVIKTYSSDKYDRYLADVFFKRGESDAAVVVSQGEFLNQRLLDEGLARRYRRRQ